MQLNIPSVRKLQTRVLAALDVHRFDVTTQEPGELPTMLTISLAGAEVAEALAALNSQHAAGGPLVSVVHLSARHVCGDFGDASEEWRGEDSFVWE